MSLMRLFDKYRSSITPPYTRKDILPLVFTLFIILLIPLTIITLNQQTLDRSRASELPSASNLPLNDTDYPIPQGAIFVAPTGTDTSACGALATPCKTISYGVRIRAASGGTVVVRQGSYHERVDANKKITIQPYPHEKVWLTGAEAVTGFVADGSLWRKDNWTYLWLASDGRPLGSTVSTYSIDPAYPMSAWPDMAFIDGQPLKQVATKAEVGQGKFFVDYTNKQLFIGDNPSGRVIEASTLDQALVLNFSGSIIRGLGFKQYANGLGNPRGNMVHTHNDAHTFENNTFAWSASTALSINYGTGHAVRGNYFIYNGILGGSAYLSKNIIFEKNYMAYNNYERFAGGYAAGGSKMVGLHDSIIRDNVFENNWGKGWWCDTNCIGVTIIRNVSRNNTSHGLMYELATKGIIASNLVYGNGEFGIKIGAGTNNTYAYNNTLARNRTNIGVLDDNRVCDANHFTDPGDGSFINGCSQTWIDAKMDGNTYNVYIKNNILSNNNGTNVDYDKGSNHLITADYTTAETGSNGMLSSMDYNAYYRTNSTIPTNLVSWKTGTLATPKHWAVYPTLADFKTARGFEVHGISIDNTTDPFFTDEANGNYTLRPDSFVKNKGEALPQNIVDAINSGLSTPVAATGQTVDIGALAWVDPSTVVPPATSQITPMPTVAPTSTPTPTSPLLTSTPAPTSIPTDIPTLTPTRIPTSTPVPTSTTLDTIKPTVNITSPLNNAALFRKSNVNITASATDNIGVDRVVFTVAGNTSTDYTAPYSYSWSVPGKPGVSYTITSTAYDARNNSSTHSIRVTSK